MKQTNTQKRWLNLGSKREQSMIKMSLMDNGDWEYDRLAIGKTDTGWFLVDVDDTGEDKSLKNNFYEENL